MDILKDTILDMNFCADARVFITVCTDMKIKRKMRKCDGNSMAGAGRIVILSESEHKVYRVSFYKRRGLNIKDEQSGSGFQCV